MAWSQQQIRADSNLLNDVYINNKLVKGKCIQPRELSKQGTALHNCATNWMKEETPIMGEFSPMMYAKEVCYVKLMGEFSPTKYAVKVLL